MGRGQTQPQKVLRRVPGREGFKPKSHVVKGEASTVQAAEMKGYRGDPCFYPTAKLTGEQFFTIPRSQAMRLSQPSRAFLHARAQLHALSPPHSPV